MFAAYEFKESASDVLPPLYILNGVNMDVGTHFDDVSFLTGKHAFEPVNEGVKNFHHQIANRSTVEEN